MIVPRLALLLLLSLASLSVQAQGTSAFSYQGRLYNNGVLANGSYTLRITPFGQVASGGQLAPPVTTPPLNVVDGIFSTTLDFGSGVFLGGPVFLAIEVQAPAGSFVLLTPRQPVTPTPYAINADKLDGLDAAQLSSSLIPFSTGTILNGSSVTAFTPILMGFGNRTFETINGSGESTSPPEAAGFAFPVPYDGTIENLQVSADLLVSSVSVINTFGLDYDFTLILAPSVPNDGLDHPASNYVTTPLAATVHFGFPTSIVFAGTFRTATALVPGSVDVSAGDRIGIRVRPRQPDVATSDISQLSFSATLSYKRAQ